MPTTTTSVLLSTTTTTRSGATPQQYENAIRRYLDAGRLGSIGEFHDHALQACSRLDRGIPLWGSIQPIVRELALDAYDRAYEKAASEAFDTAKRQTYEYAYRTTYDELLEASGPINNTQSGRKLLRTIEESANDLALALAEKEADEVAREAGSRAGGDALDNTVDAVTELLILGVVAYCPENT